MNRFFSNNLPWKIVSLFLASLLWIFVINTKNPILPKEIRGLQVSVRGINELEAKGFVLQDKEALSQLDVRVVVRGPRLEMEELLKSENGIDVKIDLTPYAMLLTSSDPESIEKSVPLTVTTNVPGIKIEEVKPANVSVVFEREAREVLPIRHKISGGSNSQYMALEPVLNMREIEISGPKSTVESVVRAEVDINVDEFSEDVLSYTVPVKLYNKDGKEVFGLKKSPEEIQVTLPIGKKKVVPLEAQFRGKLPVGYIQTNTIITPKEITIVGKAAIVDRIKSIKLEPIVLDNMIQSQTFNQGLILPNDVTPIDKIDGKVAVTIEVQKERTNQYTIQTGDIILKETDIPTGYTLEMVESEITLELSGTAEQLLAITGKNIEATIDLKALGEVSEGIYNVPIAFKIPEELKIINAPTTIQIQLNLIEETFEEEDEDEEVGVDTP